MAKKEAKKEEKVENKPTVSRILHTELREQFEAAQKGMDRLRDDPQCSFDEKEALLLGRNLDGVSATTKSQVFDPRLSTVVFERSARVMAQIPTGKIQALTQADKGKNILLNLILQKYIIPNADSQFDLLTKFRLWDLYSMVYGSFPALIDYRVDKDYVGPDLWLIPIRSFFPQSGVTTIDDAEHVFISTFVSVGWLKTRNKEKWKLDKLLEKIAASGGKKKSEQDSNRKSYIERQYEDPMTYAKGDSKQIELVTRYERDRWVTFAPEYLEEINDDAVVRDIPNPQKNNEIPVVMKHCFPLLDRIIGLGEFERGKTLQYAINSLINLYLDGVKMSIFPPMIVNPEGVVPSSLKYEAGVRWLETQANSIRNFQTSPQGTDTFQSTYTFLIAALMNQSGTTDTTVTRQTDPGMGKTPAAVQYLAAREGSRDNWDRFMMERAIEKTFNIFTDLLVNKQEKPIEMGLFKEEIEKVAAVYPDATKMFDSGEYGKVTVKKGLLQEGQTKYRFFVDEGTTMKKDEQAENEALTTVIGLLLKIPAAAQQIAQTGKIILGNKVFDFGEALRRWMITSGTQDWEKIIRELTPEEQEEAQLGGGADPGVDQEGNIVDPNQIEDENIRALAQEIAGYGEPGNGGPDQQVGAAAGA